MMWPLHSPDLNLAQHILVNCILEQHVRQCSSPPASQQLQQASNSVHRSNRLPQQSDMDIQTTLVGLTQMHKRHET